MVDRRILERIASAADFEAADTVVEVGAGTGLLTELLAERASRLLAMEVDSRLCARLRRRFTEKGHVTVVEADVLAHTAEDLLREGGGGLPYVVVGNLPFFIATAVVRHFLQAVAPPRWLLVTLQAEVAESMVAGPGRMTYLAVETQMLARVRMLFYIPSRAFRPSPKVRSAVVRLDVLDAPEVEVDDRQAFLDLVRAGFAAPRKTVRNSLAIGLGVPPTEANAVLTTAGIDPALRPAMLRLEDWRQMYLAYRSNIG